MDTAKNKTTCITGEIPAIAAISATRAPPANQILVRPTVMISAARNHKCQPQKDWRHQKFKHTIPLLSPGLLLCIHSFMEYAALLDFMQLEYLYCNRRMKKIQCLYEKCTRKYLPEPSKNFHIKDIVIYMEAFSYIQLSSWYPPLLSAVVMRFLPLWTRCISHKFYAP